MLNSFEKSTAHTLTVEATDGTTTTVKSCKVKRIRSPGYVVYIGQIKGTADGQSYYWTERNVLDDPYDEKAAFILDPELTLEANDICSFTFTVPVSNPYYDKLRLKKPVISVEEDGHEIFMPTRTSCWAMLAAAASTRPVWDAPTAGCMWMCARQKAGGRGEHRWKASLLPSSAVL